MGRCSLITAVLLAASTAMAAAQYVTDLGGETYRSITDESPAIALTTGGFVSSGLVSDFPLEARFRTFASSCADDDSEGTTWQYWGMLLILQ